MEYSYFIISCKRNKPILQLCVDCIMKFDDGYSGIYISTDGNMDIDHVDSSCIFVDNSSSFGERVSKALLLVPSKYVIVMCDDFIVEAPVNSCELKRIVDEFERDADISAITLAKTSGRVVTNEILLSKYVLKSKYSEYKTSLQCSIWNKMAIAFLMKSARNPWEFELFSNRITFTAVNKFYCLVNDEYQPIKYNRGRFVIRGKVVKPEKERLEKILGLTISTAGFEYTESFEQGVGMSILDRIARRIKLILFTMKYKVYSHFKTIDLNNMIR